MNNNETVSTAKLDLIRMIINARLTQEELQEVIEKAHEIIAKRTIP